MAELSRAGGIPVYVRIRETIRDEITKGALLTHDGQVVNAAVRAKLGLG